MRSILLTLLGLSASILSQAQTCFFAEDTIGCAPFTAHFTNCSGEDKPTFYMFGDVTPTFTTDSFYTFTEPGTYTITQIVGNGGNLDSLERVDYIRVVTNTEPDYKLQACEGRLVTAEILEDLYDIYIVDWGDGSDNDTLLGNSSLSHIFSLSQEQTIEIQGKYFGAPCGGTAIKSVTTFDSLLEPNFNYLLVGDQSSSGSIELNWNPVDQFNYAFHSWFSNSTSQVASDSVQSSLSDSVMVWNARNTLDSSTCFMVSNYDGCGNEVLSDTLCSISLQASAANNFNQLDWTAYNWSGFVSYNVMKDNNLLVAQTSNSLVDNDVICSQEYCYQIESEINGSSHNYSSYSDTVCITATSTDIPTPLDEIIVSNSGDNFDLSWINVGLFSQSKVHIAKSDFDMTWDSPLEIVTQDSFYSHSRENDDMCFRIHYSDDCDNISVDTDGPWACSIELFGEAQLDASIALDWNEYVSSSSLPGLSYTIEWLDEEFNVYRSMDLGSAQAYQDSLINNTSQVYYYRVKATWNGNNTSYSNIVSFTVKQRVYFPTAFSPNGDGNNEVFTPVGLFVKSFHMDIFNQWGELIYQTSDVNKGWDGTYQGSLAQGDVYSFKAEYEDFQGNKRTKSGAITLVY